MITDADIEKMKKVFVTKEDLKSFATKDEINKRFDGVDKKFVGIDKRFEGIDKRFDNIDKRFDGMDKKIDNLSDNLHKSTNDLIELITDGFNLTDKRLERLEDKVFGTN